MTAASGRFRTGMEACCALVALVLGSCSDRQAPAETPPTPVVVYAGFADRDYWPLLFDRYTQETGATVIVRQGEPGALVEDVIRNDVTPPADLLITPTVRGVYRAAEDGALRPIDSAIVEGRVSPALRDPDGFWTALSYRFPAIAFDSAVTAVADVPDLLALADPRYRDRLCLSTSADTTMRSIIAGMLDEHGIRETELAVRGWMANLHGEVAASQSRLWSELEEGGCAVALVSQAGAEWLSDSENVRIKIHDLAPRFVDIEGMGIARHAGNPDGALRLIEWLLDDAVQASHTHSEGVHPAIEPYDGGDNVSRIAWNDHEAVKLAARARYP